MSNNLPPPRPNPILSSLNNCIKFQDCFLDFLFLIYFYYWPLVFLDACLRVRPARLNYLLHKETFFIFASERSSYQQFSRPFPRKCISVFTSQTGIRISANNIPNSYGLYVLQVKCDVIPWVNYEVQDMIA